MPAKGCGQPLKYSPAVIEYIKSNWGNGKTPDEIADAIGVGRAGIRSFVCKLRREGHDIKNMRAKVGEQRIRIRRGDTKELFQKQADGNWKRIGVVSPKTKKYEPKKVKVPKPKRAPAPRRPPSKPEKKVCEIKPFVQPAGKHWQKIDGRTWVLR